MNTKTLKKYNNALNELKQPLNDVFRLLTEIDCYTLPMPISDNKIKMIIFDKGKEIKKNLFTQAMNLKLNRLNF